MTANKITAPVTAGRMVTADSYTTFNTIFPLVCSSSLSFCASAAFSKGNILAIIGFTFPESINQLCYLL